MKLDFMNLINWALNWIWAFKVVNGLIGFCCTKLDLGKLDWIQLGPKPLPLSPNAT